MSNWIHQFVKEEERWRSKRGENGRCKTNTDVICLSFIKLQKSRAVDPLLFWILLVFSSSDHKCIFLGLCELKNPLPVGLDKDSLWIPELCLSWECRHCRRPNVFSLWSYVSDVHLYWSFALGSLKYLLDQCFVVFHLVSWVNNLPRFLCQWTLVEMVRRPQYTHYI